MPKLPQSAYEFYTQLIVWCRAGQYVVIYHTGAISLKYPDAISKMCNKTDYRDIEISQKIAIS